MTKRMPAQFSDDYWIWRWVYRANGGSDVLHRVAAPFNPKKRKPWRGFRATTLCGQTTVLQVPGVMSRMAAPRCKKCCAAGGFEYGEGNPYNFGIAN